MAYKPISRVLLRAPLLPLKDLRRAPGALFRKGIPAVALALGSPDLAEQQGRSAERALRNYARRAAFRPTPHGLWAGVTMATLGPRTRIRTGAPRAHLTVAWGRLAALGRALLDTPEAREETRLRVAPSLLHDARQAHWLAFGDGPQARVVTADLDAATSAVIARAATFTPWPEVRRALGAVLPVKSGDELSLDEFLLLLIDDGLLTHDLTPPLVGPPPLEWMIARLKGAKAEVLTTAAASLAELAERMDGEAPEVARAALLERLAALPGDTGGPALQAVLLHTAEAMLSRTAVERAARLAALLFRVQDALQPPAAERALDPVVAETLDAVTEVFGAGALELGALARGDYGTPLQPDRAEEDGLRAGPSQGSGSLLAYLVEQLMATVAAGETELVLDAGVLDAVTPSCELPGSFELVLAPAREKRGAPPGSGWLLGLHAPAGATWGRFAHALGAPLASALAELAERETAARPGEVRTDVAFAPAPELADLATHPPVRSTTLALSGWPAGEAVTPAQLEICVDPSALAPLALRAGAQPLCPSPLHRLRSTTAPAGPYRLLCGWSLYRQHAPWALQLGPLSELGFVPRISLDGFVVAPASWRLPGALTPSALKRWRKLAGVPRHVQVGREDELLLVDLDEAGAGETLARAEAQGGRLFEVWPPLESPVDAGGRRVEAVVAVVDVPEGDAAKRSAAAIAGVAAAGPVAPPRWRPAAPGWRTYKLFGAPDRADRLLAEVLGPVAAAALKDGELEGWFFLRYVDGPGRRDHLRLRAHAVDAARADRFAERLLTALLPARAAGDLVAVETAEYHREYARYGTDAMVAVERVFESDSEWVCTLAADADAAEHDGTEWLVRSFDALAVGLGLDDAARLALARRRRAAHADTLSAVSDVLSAEYRERQPRLYQALTERRPPALAAHVARLALVRPSLPSERWQALLPPLLHLGAVRLAGAHRVEEIRAYYFWERALESALARNKGPVSR